MSHTQNVSHPHSFSSQADNKQQHFTVQIKSQEQHQFWSIIRLSAQTWLMPPGTQLWQHQKSRRREGQRTHDSGHRGIWPPGTQRGRGHRSPRSGPCCTCSPRGACRKEPSGPELPRQWSTEWVWPRQANHSTSAYGSHLQSWGERDKHLIFVFPCPAEEFISSNTKDRVCFPKACVRHYTSTDSCKAPTHKTQGNIP